MHPKWINALSLSVLLHVLCVLLFKVHSVYKTEPSLATPNVVWITPLKALPLSTDHILDRLEHVKTITEAMLDID